MESKSKLTYQQSDRKREKKEKIIDDSYKIHDEKIEVEETKNKEVNKVTKLKKKRPYLNNSSSLLRRMSPSRRPRRFSRSRGR